MSSLPPVPEDWVPKTELGRLVLSGKIVSMEEVLARNLKVREPEVVKLLLPNLKQEVIEIRLVQKQTDAGEKSKFRATVVVGDEAGWVGIGMSKAAQIDVAIEKATNKALLNVIPVVRGCGSWECGCGAEHSIPVSVSGKAGSVRVVLIPGPRGLGIVAGETGKIVLRMAGVQDVWVRTFGETRTIPSYALAVYNALKNLLKFRLRE